jgi:uncharacterized sulfatase
MIFRLKKINLVLFFVFTVLSIRAVTKDGNRPNFLIIMADDCTYRDIEVYGGQAMTPNLMQLAKEGLKFNRCFQATAMCAPTRSNLLTGIYPVRNGAYANHSQSHKHIKSIVHHMLPEGYMMGLTGKRHIGPESVYPFQYSEKSDDPDLNFIKDFFKKSKTSGNPFCLFAMCSSPHGPWTKGDTTQYPSNEVVLAPNLINTKETRNAFSGYLAEITYFDKQVGQILSLLESSNCSNNTVVIVLGEHGSLFPFGKWTCYDTGLQSAMIVKYPNHVKAGTETDAMVEYTDMVPTILDIAGIDPVTRLDGKSFKQVLYGNTGQHKNYVFGVHTTRGILAATQGYGIRSVRNDSLKYILNLFPENQFENLLLVNPSRLPDRLSYLKFMVSWRQAAEHDNKAKYIFDRYRQRSNIELYNIANDPYELVNLALDPDYGYIMNQLHKKLMNWMDSQGDKGRITEMKVDIRPLKN